MMKQTENLPDLQDVSGFTNNTLQRKEINTRQQRKKKAKHSKENSVKLKIVKLSKHATKPSRGSKGAAGLDLYSAHPVYIEPWKTALVYTDIKIKLPQDCYGRIAERSGLALNLNIHVLGGVMDQEYTGNIKVILQNLSNTSIWFSKGKRIAQLILEKIYTPEVEECVSINKTERGDKGFGSSGMD